jgi:hypothetical protein
MEGDYTVLVTWAQLNHLGPYKRGRKVRVRCNVMGAEIGEEALLLPVKMEKGQESRNTGSLWKLERRPTLLWTP